MVGFATYQLERTNISSALTGGLATAISVNEDTINLGNQLMFLGVIILEIPSNIILHVIGPRRWIGGQVFIFGLVAALQVFIRDKAGFLTTRTILGLAEAGYIPGAMFTLSTWYTKDEITKRIAIFFFGMFGGTAVSPLLGAALLRLDGKGSLTGWQWIFLGNDILDQFGANFELVVEGIWSVTVSLVLMFFLPERDTLKSTLEIDEHLENESRAKEATARKIPIKTVWKTLTNFHKWPHFVATACIFSTWSPLTIYTPSILLSLGFSRIESNALASIGSFMTLPVVFFFAWLSDKTQKRGLMVMVASTTYFISLIALKLIQPHVGRWSKFGLWTTVNSLAVGYHPIHNAWIQMNSPDPEERSICMV
ncbi:uncharacterized protein N7498_003048 [Penicillium cinerascens]|uniref:Major facilitator superfamily (MFS) profile domain-containing protein n=1 Tax=Penicillium cinerascens TaxID=70096 RepID=A0A9W9NB65_9EURO|nr:uncharacterized protein N7498_003048 [Penicillium cinerascens]KAJ5216641.1 hypothetical protein N7498_003048 [Penicillium cinerascens]